jgi:hypothetical protein
VLLQYSSLWLFSWLTNSSPVEFRGGANAFVQVATLHPRGTTHLTRSIDDCQSSGEYRMRAKDSWILLSIALAAPAEPVAAQVSLGFGKSNTAQVNLKYGKLPLTFGANQRQTAPQAKFLARGSGYSVFLTASGMVPPLRPAVPPSKKSLAEHRLNRTTLPSQSCSSSCWGQIRLRKSWEEMNSLAG